MSKVTKLGKELRKIRIDHDLPRKKMAAKIGISDKLLSKIEGGKEDITADVMDKVCDTYLESSQKADFRDVCYDSMSGLMLRQHE